MMYTREQAIEDGVLVDVSKMAKEVGIGIPVALTKSVYEGYIVPSLEDKKEGQDEDGRLWDTLWMFITTIQCGNRNKTHNLSFNVVYIMNGRKQIVTLKTILSTGDTREPVFTIMLPEED